MKIMHEQVDLPGRSKIRVKLQEKPHFTYPWHFHSAYELLYVLDGSGTSFVADHIEEFQSDDLVLLGTNLPHFWKSDESYYDPDNQKKITYVVIQFSNDFFKEAISEYPEFFRIKELLERSGRGVRFSKAFAEKARRKIFKVVKTSGFERMLRALELLSYLAETEEYKLLAGELYRVENHDFTSDRLAKVMNYLNSNYLDKIELGKVAAVANLNPSAFCRFFKEKSGKSLVEFINDMRINYACMLMIEGKMTVTQVCYESGFNNQSNFNRIFKKYTGFTPTLYSQKFHKNSDLKPKEEVPEV